MKKFLSLLLVPMLLSASVFDLFDSLSPRAKKAQEAVEAMEGRIEQALQEFELHGVAIGVVVDGQVVYAKGFGYRDFENGLPVTADTIFGIGSCTKAFTAFLAGQCVDAGCFHWDDRVIDLLPDFRLHDQYATQNLTVRDLLTHRSGLPRHDYMWYNTKVSRAELMKRLRHLEPSYDIRERYQYNNLMYLTAGYAMERLFNKSWEELVTEKILHPLGMKSTTFSPKELTRFSDVAVPYKERDGVLKRLPWRDFSPIGPGGSMNSNVNDLLSWVKVNLQEGIFQGQSLIKGATLQEIHSPQVIVTGSPPHNATILYSYGIGWGVASMRGHYLVVHDGGVDGFSSTIALLPQEKVGVVVLANKNITSLPNLLSLEILDKVLALPFIDHLEKGKSGLEKAKKERADNQSKEDLLRKKGTQLSHPLKDYVGEYEHPGYGTVTIGLDPEREGLQATFNGITYSLTHWHYDIFKVVAESEELFFSREGTKMIFQMNLLGEIQEVLIPFEPTAHDIVFVKKPSEQRSQMSYLDQFTGAYEYSGYTVDIALKDGVLVAIIPGQPLYELVATEENEFTVKSMNGYTIRFVLNGDKRVEELIFICPYGVFPVTPKRANA